MKIEDSVTRGQDQSIGGACCRLIRFSIFGTRLKAIFRLGFCDAPLNFLYEFNHFFYILMVWKIFKFDESNYSMKFNIWFCIDFAM